MSTRPEDHRVGRYNAVTAKPCVADYGLAIARAVGVVVGGREGAEGGLESSVVVLTG